MGKLIIMARPKADIDWDKIDRLLEAGCDGTEVAATFGINEETLYRRCEKDNKVGFSDYKATKRASGDRLLRVKQFEIAMTGDKTMLVWLGKQRLGQSEKNEHSGPGGGPMQFTGFNFLPGDSNTTGTEEDTE